MEITKEIVELKKRVDRLESMLQINPPEILGKKMSAREFLLTTKVEDSVQKTLALAYFLEKFEGLRSYSVKELERSFMIAKERVPTNTNDMINKNISKGLMMETEDKRDKKKTWCLTNAGVRYIETQMLQ
ncbi:MAG TPA: hypothetical protein VJB38_14515 [Bacteroidota bacterium]|nr:hypothetical protein [Bacteroidota bacterium]